MQTLYDALCARGRIITDAATIRDRDDGAATPLTLEQVMASDMAQTALVMWYQANCHTPAYGVICNEHVGCNRLYGDTPWGMTWPSFAASLKLPERYQRFLIGCHDLPIWTDPKK